VPTYISFAYKLALSPEQVRSMAAGLPKWFPTDLFDIEARAEGDPTKDQMRLMMQSLLADRFRLALHFETHKSLCSPLCRLSRARWGRNSFLTRRVRVAMCQATQILSRLAAMMPNWKGHPPACALV